jgi:hypothetical protein
MSEENKIYKNEITYLVFKLRIFKGKNKINVVNILIVN